MIRFSEKTREFCVYHFDEMTNEYVGKEVVVVPPHTGLPAGCCLTSPSADKANYVQVWDGKKWQYVEDHRGIVVYEKSNGAPVDFFELGPIPDQYVTVEPTSEFSVWAGDQWIEDTARKDIAIAQNAQQRKIAELLYAQELLKPLEYAERLDMATEKEKQNIKSLMKHIVLLNRIDTAKSKNIQWPELTLVS